MCRLILFAIIFINKLSFCQDVELSKSEIKFIKNYFSVEVTRKDKININVLKWDTLDIYYFTPDSTSELSKIYFDKTVDSLFSYEDKVFVVNQMNKSIVSGSIPQWTKCFFKRGKLIDPNKEKNNSYNISYTEYSIPLFSKNYELLILKENYYCGTLCETTSIRILKKNSLGKWEEIKVIFTFVS